jgi:multiple sugar transport system ATP-binding protein
MVRDPAAFLFDEPLSNLDAQLRTQMRLEIKKLHQRLGTTIVFVTHDQVEAMTMADRIVVMRDGRILQVGTPVELYEHPNDIFTARFIGSPTMNLLPARLVEEAGQRIARLDGLESAIPLPAGRALKADGPDVLVGVRPHDLVVGPAAGAGGISLAAEVSVVEPLGSETLVHLDLGETSVIASAPGKVVPKAGDRVTAHAQPGSLYLFDARSERALCRM